MRISAPAPSGDEPKCEELPDGRGTAYLPPDAPTGYIEIPLDRPAGGRMTKAPPQWRGRTEIRDSGAGRTPPPAMYLTYPLPGGITVTDSWGFSPRSMCRTTRLQSLFFSQNLSCPYILFNIVAFVLTLCYVVFC